MRKLLIAIALLGVIPVALVDSVAFGATSKQPACVRPTTATSAPQKHACYYRLWNARAGGPAPTTERELLTLAANLCDNTVNEFEFLIGALVIIDTVPKEIVADKVSVIDAFCPEKRLQFEAAVDAELGLSLPKPPRYTKR